MPEALPAAPAVIPGPRMRQPTGQAGAQPTAGGSMPQQQGRPDTTPAPSRSSSASTESPCLREHSRWRGGRSISVAPASTPFTEPGGDTGSPALCSPSRRRCAALALCMRCRSASSPPLASPSGRPPGSCRRRPGAGRRSARGCRPLWLSQHQWRPPRPSPAARTGRWAHAAAAAGGRLPCLLSLGHCTMSAMAQGPVHSTPDVVRAAVDMQMCVGASVTRQL